MGEIGALLSMIRCLFALILASPTLWALNLSSLEEVPVQEGGRKKPYLVFAQESLLALSGKTAIVVDDRKRDAMDIITTFWLNPEGW